MKNGSTFTFGAALLALGALLFTPTHADAQERVSARGWNWYHGTDTMKLDASEKTLLARYLNKKCLVQKMASPKRAFFACCLLPSPAANRNTVFGSGISASSWSIQEV